MNSDNNPIREPDIKKRKIEPKTSNNNNNNSSQQTTSNTRNNDQIIEILSDEESAPPRPTTTIVNLDTELDDSTLTDVDYRDDNYAGDGGNEIQIVGVNTSNPTPLSTPLSNINRGGVPSNTNINNNNNRTHNDNNDDDDEEDDDDLEILEVRTINNPQNERLLTPVGDIPFVREHNDYRIFGNRPIRNSNPPIIRSQLEMGRRQPLPSPSQIQQGLMPTNRRRLIRERYTGMVHSDYEPWITVPNPELYGGREAFDPARFFQSESTLGRSGLDIRVIELGSRPEDYALIRERLRRDRETTALNSSRQRGRNTTSRAPRRSYLELAANETSNLSSFPHQPPINSTEHSLHSRRGVGNRNGRVRRQQSRHIDSPPFLDDHPFLSDVTTPVPRELRFLGNTYHDVGLALDNLMDSSYTPGGFNAAIERSIMQRIDEDNNRTIDRRLAQETNYNKKTKNEIEKKMANQDEGHTSIIKSNENLVCELCNIILGEGVSEDFHGDSRYNEKFSHHCETYNCQAPWFCVYPFTKVDIELSKRIFVAKCGHLFCGRCVKNIGNRPKIRRKSKTNGGGGDVSILNPKFYAPSTCPELQCQKKFLAKSFTEVYF